MLMALTREVSAALGQCEMTYLPRVPLDIERARAQHDAYEWALVELGCTIRRIEAGPDMPDSVFIEDTAVMFAEGAVITRPGAESRRQEPADVASALARLGLPSLAIEAPGTLDGGDVLVVGRQVFIGSSSRTNAAATEQLRSLLEPLGYRVRAVPVEGCLHLKSAVNPVSPDTVLINRQWVPADAFAGLTLVDADPDEPHAANALLVGETVVVSASYPRTRARLEQRGYAVRVVHMDEFERAEGGITCCSLIWAR